jgi:phage replication O-like protein O
MANPQIENGYTKVANELLDAIYKIPLSRYESQVFWYIIRKTYGYNKKKDWISSTQITEDTKILKQNVSRTLSSLKKRKMILRNGRLIGIQKDYEIWESNHNRLPKKLSKEITKVIKIDYKSNQNRLPQKKKEKRNIYHEDSLQIEMSRYFYQKLKEFNPYMHKISYQVWGKEIDTMLNIDKILPDDIYAVMDWCVRDKFWKPVIQSTKKLREHFPKMFAKMKNEKSEPVFEKKLKPYRKEKE